MALSLLLDPEPPPPPSGGGMVSVPLAIALGLLASFIQSLGLTVQRKSHLIAARQPPHARPPEWRQPLWLVGFLIFIIANIGGTIFQIGALPIVMLAPLGAVSLLYNALLAKFLLADALGSKMVGGTALILLGAVLIGYFGAIQEPPHTLDELLALFGRPPFVALGTVLFMAVFSILVVAHLAEWQQNTPPQEKKSSGKSSKHRTRKSAYSKLTRRWSAPSLAPLDEVSETTSGVATPVLAVRDQIGQQQPHGQSYLTATRPSVPQRRSYGATQDRDASPPRRHRKPRLSLSPPRPDNSGRSKLFLAVAFAAISGTLSGLCLLLAKSGVELLVQTFGLGRNQFNRFGSWALVGIMLFAALAQLWYLNKALRLADPTLVCPLAFCFYNTSSIALGLIYFDQLSAISTPSLLCIITGIVILLVGVFIVSMKPSVEELTGDGAAADEEQGLESIEQSTLETQELQSSPTETEALLANAGGIGGPHLPPPSVLVQPTPQTAPPAQPLTASPLEDAPLSPLSAPVSSKRRHSRSASAGTTHQMMAGLGLHLPHYIEPSPLGRKHSRRASLAASFTSPAGSSKTPSPSLPSSSEMRSSREVGAPSAATLRQRRRTFSSDLYSSILNRGLSIGIGPSSPGFHIGPFSPVEDDDEDEEGADIVAPLTAPPTPTGDSLLAAKGARAASPGRRTFSDADAELVRRAREIASARGRQRKDGTPRSPLHLQTATEGEEEESNDAVVTQPSASTGADEAGSSTLYVDEGGKRLDSSVLSDRLTALRTSASRSPHATSSSSRTPLPQRRGGGGNGSMTTRSNESNRNSSSSTSSSLPMVRGVKDWWRKNVKGSDDNMRDGERRRLLE